MKRKTLWAILCVALYCGFASSLWAAQPDLAVADWSVNSPHSLATNPPREGEVLALVKKLTHEEHLLFCSPPRFARLRDLGNLSLVVETQSGRLCDVQIIDKTTSGFELYAADSSFAQVEDLDGTGSSKLVADVDLTFYEGVGHREATWPVIYAWTGNGYNDVSGKYKQYYLRRLKSLKNQIAALSSAVERPQAPPPVNPSPQPTNIHRAGVPKAGNAWGAFDVNPPESSVQEASPSAASTPAAMPDLGSLDCIKAEAAKIERFVGISTDAGMSDAIEWANSNDVSTRLFAVEVLSDIGTPNAVVHLRTLSHDSNRVVARVAKDSLASIGEPVAHTVDRLDLAEPPSK